MRLAYLLLLLLYLSSSVCRATSRNHRLFVVHGGADDGVAVVVPAASSMAHGDHRGTAMHVWRSTPPGEDVPAAELTTTAAAEKSALPGAIEGVAMAPMPAAADRGQAEVGGSDSGGDGGSSSASEGGGGGGGGGQHDGAVDDTGVDYAPPKTHPPSHN